jgi:hypothetical protein
MYRYIYIYTYIGGSPGGKIDGDMRSFMVRKDESEVPMYACICLCVYGFIHLDVFRYMYMNLITYINDYVYAHTRTFEYTNMHIWGYEVIYGEER